LWTIDLIIFYFFFLLFYFWVSFYYYYFGLRQKCDICHRVVTQSGDTEKIIEGSGTDDIIQYNNNILALWQAYIL